MPVPRSPDGTFIRLARVGANGAAVVKTSSEFVAEVEGTQGTDVSAVAWAEDGRRARGGVEFLRCRFLDERRGER